MKRHLALIVTAVLVTSSVRGSDEFLGVITTQQSSSSQSISQSPELAEAEQLSAQVVTLYKEGKFDKALPLAEKVLAIREKSLGPDNLLVASALRNLAEVLSAKGRRKEAESTFQRYITTYEHALGTGDPRIVEALDRYVCLLEGNGDTEEAKQAQKRLYKVENGFDFDDSGKKSGSGGLMAARLISAPAPAYPTEAKRARLNGPVVMKITVDETGKVAWVKTLCGHPILARVSEESILRASYQPIVVNGKPVKVTGIAVYRFKIQ